MGGKKLILVGAISQNEDHMTIQGNSRRTGLLDALALDPQPYHAGLPAVLINILSPFQTITTKASRDPSSLAPLQPLQQIHISTTPPCRIMLGHVSSPLQSVRLLVQHFFLQFGL